MNRESNPLEAVLLRALELLEGGSIEEARRELRGALGRPADEPLSDGELDRALEQASPEVDRMLHADDVAHAAIRQADDALRAELAPEPLGNTFATATMAELLERQGDQEAASRIRESLGEPEPLPPDAPPELAGGRQRTIRTLESWLANLQTRPRSRRGVCT